MDIQFYEEIAKKFIYETGVGNLVSENYNNNFRASDEYYCMNGASKVVLIPKDTSKEFVVKIPFTGSKEEYYECDCGNKNPDNMNEPCKYSCSECNECSHFICNIDIEEYVSAVVSEDETDWDYCASEAYFYSRAVEKGVEEFFLQTKFINTILGHPFYIQKRAGAIGVKAGLNPTKDSLEKFSKVGGYSPFGTNFGALLIDFYGEERVLKLFAFIKEEHINDLHSDNIGYLDNQPVIIDYSGFNS